MGNLSGNDALPIRMRYTLRNSAFAQLFPFITVLAGAVG